MKTILLLFISIIYVKHSVAQKVHNLECSAGGYNTFTLSACSKEDTIRNGIS